MKIFLDHRNMFIWIEKVSRRLREYCDIRDMMISNDVPLLQLYSNHNKSSEILNSEIWAKFFLGTLIMFRTEKLSERMEHILEVVVSKWGFYYCWFRTTDPYFYHKLSSEILNSEIAGGNFLGSSKHVYLYRKSFRAIGTVLRDTRYGDFKRGTLTLGIIYLLKYWILKSEMKTFLGHWSMLVWAEKVSGRLEQYCEIRDMVISNEGPLLQA